MSVSEQAERVSLKQWISRTYIRPGMLQLLAVNIIFVVFLLGLFWLLEFNQGAQARKEEEQELIAALQAKSDWVNARLSEVQGHLQVLQRQTERLLNSPGTGDTETPLVLSDKRVLMKPADDGGVAVYYSTRAQDLSAREAKTRQLLPLGGLIADLQQASPLIRQSYLNTPDQLNLLYPFQDVASRFPPDLDLTDFSFYYLADARNNPQRTPVWTDAYLDPAGLGWIISHIAPVYRADTLEAVVGVDLTIQGLINSLFSLPQPWSGYVVLVGKDGNILALPPEGEEDFNLQELTDAQYSFRQVTDNEFKPELFNLYKRPEMDDLSRLVAHQQAGLAQVDLSQPSVVAWNTVPLTGWKLLAVTPAHELYADVYRFSDYLFQLGLLVLLTGVAVAGLQLGILRNHGRKLSQQLHQPLEQLGGQLDSALKDSAPAVLQVLQLPVSDLQRMADQVTELTRQNGQLHQTVHQHQSRCHKQNDYFRALLNSMPLPVFDTDAEYRIQGCNRAFESFFGKNEAELRLHLLTELLPVSLPEEGAFSKEVMLTNANGQSRYMRIMIACVSDNPRSRTPSVRPSVVGLMADLTELYQEREQLRQDRERVLETSSLQQEYLQAMRQELEQSLQSLAELAAQLHNEPDQVARLSLQLQEKTEALLLLNEESWLQEEQRRPGNTGPVRQPVRKNSARVLVVDDGPVNTMLARSVLEKAGYSVDVVYSGQDALARLTEQHYQVVLMDIFMPQMDGIETTRRWREREQAMQRRPAAIIALTANVIESERQRFFDAGMNEYLAKPYQPTELRERVDYWRRQYEQGQIA